MTEETKTTKAAAAVRKCRVCGCTDHAPCMKDGTPCYWVGPDLCSACTEGGQLSLGPEDLRALAAVKIGFETDGLTALCVLGVLQLALGHPHLPDGPARKAAQQLARALQDGVSTTENLAKLAAAGWGQRG